MFVKKSTADFAFRILGYVTKIRIVGTAEMNSTAPDHYFAHLTTSAAVRTLNVFQGSLCNGANDCVYATNEPVCAFGR